MTHELTLTQAVHAYLDMRRQRYAKTTWINDEVILNRLLKTTGDIPCRDVTPDHVETLFYAPNTGLVHNMSAATFNVQRSRLKAFCVWATDEGHTRGDLMRKVERRAQLKKARRHLTLTEMAAVIDSTDHPRDRILLALACNTGLRIRDILHLKVGDVDLDAGYLKALIAKTQVEKILPITADLDNELRCWLRFYEYECDGIEPEWFLVPRRHDYDWVRNKDGVIDENGSSLIPDKPLTYPFRIINKALETVGVNGRQEGFHTLRRSAGRAVFEAAVASGDPRAIHVAQAFYGHADARMTQHYIGTDEEQRKLDKLLRGRKFLTGDPTEHSMV